MFYERSKYVIATEKKAEEATEMSAIPTYNSRGNLRKHITRLWMTFMLVLAVAMAASAVVAAQAQAGSNSPNFPKTTLMQGQTELQDGRFNFGTWHYYENGEWVSVHADGFYGFPHADVVGEGSRLHIKINKPERPETFTIRAYSSLDQDGMPVGQKQRLHTTLSRIERDGETVGWNVFFRVNEPDRHYYLETSGRWERVPGTHISYGTIHENFHVKTTD